MSSVLDLNCDTSDSEDDQDYVPPANADSGDSRSEHSDDAGEDESVSASKPRSRKGKRNVKRTTKGGKSDESDPKPENKPKLTEEDEKKRIDDLFKSFLSDVQPVVKKPSSSAAENVSSEQSDDTPKNEEKKVLVEEYEFAGETVTVTKEPDSGLLSSAVSNSKPLTASAEKPSAVKRPGGGLSSLVGALKNKKQKISTLQKSLLDWNNFKKEEGISEELQTHNKGKEGYIERQAFLQRSDLRQFEIERNLRLSKRGQP